MEYSELTDEDLVNLRRDRLVKLEAAHFSAILQCEEAPQDAALLHKLRTLESAIRLHRERLAAMLTGDGRVSSPEVDATL
jgi:hypothetical protein